MANKDWIVIKSGHVPITTGVLGKFGGEKPHMSFWLDKDILINMKTAATITINQ